jgi:hypothetical protein
MTPLFTLRRALSDPNLLGTAFAGDSWTAWRILLIAAMGEPLTDDERAAFTALTGRAQEPLQRVEEMVSVVGRRGGKSRAMATLTAYLAGLYRHELALGERGIVLCIAPDQRQAAITLEYAAAAFEASPILAQLIANRTADTLELSNCISVEVRSASFRRLRGPTYIAVIADEAAFWYSDELSSNADTEILNAVRPGLATTGGPLIIASSPYARRGVLWETYRAHYGPAGDPLILVAQGASRDFNPSLPSSVVERAMERDAASASAEFLAQFRTDIEGFVSREVVEAATVPGRHELPPCADLDAAYVGFCDPSGGSSDSMTLGIAHRDRDGRAVLDAVRERRPPFSPDDVVLEFSALLKSFGCRKVVGDRYGGEWPRERFRTHGVEYVPAELTKSDIYRDLLPLLNSGHVELLDLPRLASQLCGLERRTARGGKDSIDHSPGAHDDIANAAAGALLLANSAAASLWRREALLVAGRGHDPTQCDAVFAVLISTPAGDAAVAYFARQRFGAVPLTLIDFTCEKLSPGMLSGVLSCLGDLSKAMRPHRGAMLFTSQPLAEELERSCGHRAEVVDAIIAAGQASLALAASVHVTSGRVKLGTPALARAETHPLSILAVDTSGEDDDDPLRMAALVGIALALDANRQLGRAA